MTTRVTVLKPTNEERVDASSGNDTQLPGARYSSCETPIGYSDSHPALNEQRL
jgi:hypothetical protein